MWFLPSPAAEWVLHGDVLWLTCGTSPGPYWEWWQTLVSVIYYKMGRCSSCFFFHHPLLSDKRRLCNCGTQAGGLEIKARTMVGSVPGFCSYHPRWEQGEGRAAAAVFPQELFLGFSFISSKIRVTGEGSKDSRRLKGVGSRNGNAWDRGLQRIRRRETCETRDKPPDYAFCFASCGLRTWLCQLSPLQDETCSLLSMKGSLI